MRGVDVDGEGEQWMRIQHVRLSQKVRFSVCSNFGGDRRVFGRFERR